MSENLSHFNDIWLDTKFQIIDVTLFLGLLIRRQMSEYTSFVDISLPSQVVKAAWDVPAAGLQYIFLSLYLETLLSPLVQHYFNATCRRLLLLYSDQSCFQNLIPRFWSLRTLLFFYLKNILFLGIRLGVLAHQILKRIQKYFNMPVS